jgi:hypothetical protein
VQRATVEARPSDERVAHFGREGGVQPYGRRLRIERLERELLRARRLGLVKELGLLILSSQAVKLLAYLWGEGAVVSTCMQAGPDAFLAGGEAPRILAPQSRRLRRASRTCGERTPW